MFPWWSAQSHAKPRIQCCGARRSLVLVLRVSTSALAGLFLASVTVAAEPVATKYLPNTIRVHSNVYSGGLPSGDAAFEELADFGIRTIISVDGAEPNVALAAKHGLRYVHLPHGYDGISEDRVHELAKAVKDLPGPIYIHCHHGKHRSPAAAAVACVAAGLVPDTQALAILKLAGTSRRYRGLYRSAGNAKVLPPEFLDQLVVEFRETADVPLMVESMVAIEQTHDRLVRLAEANWKSVQQDPDLDPAHQALLMHEHFTELGRTTEVRQMPEGFLRLLRDSESAARSMENALLESNPSATSFLQTISSN